jgi:hypothetical protein
MSFLKSIFVPIEVKASLAAIEEVSFKFQTEAFALVRRELEKYIRKNPDELVRTIQESGGRTPREWVYCQIGNIAGDMLETGQYHIYRGVINPLGPGQDLLTMHDATCDELVLMKAVELEVANDQKAALRRNLLNVG